MRSWRGGPRVSKEPLQSTEDHEPCADDHGDRAPEDAQQQDIREPQATTVQPPAVTEPVPPPHGDADSQGDERRHQWFDSCIHDRRLEKAVVDLGQHGSRACSDAEEGGEQPCGRAKKHLCVESLWVTLVLGRPPVANPNDGPDHGVDADRRVDIAVVE